MDTSMSDPMDLDTNSADEIVLADYEELCSSEEKPVLFSSVDPEVAMKNRFTNIVPVDATRIRLRHHRRSDYINANLVSLQRRQYVCTQGPLLETTNDFWQMVFEQDSRVIVMLCNLVEKNRIRCHKYWPRAGESRKYGLVHVAAVKAVTLPGIHLRKFRLTDSSGGNERVVTQVHYTEWPDFAVPDSTKSFRSVLDILDHYLSEGGGPPVVHCSAGIGRTGVFVATHSSLTQLRTTGLCNVRETVKAMRQQRAGMIQTPEQYLFVYTTLREVLFSLDNPQFQQLLESSGETDENSFVNHSLMNGRSFNCLVDEESQIVAPPPSPFLMGQ